MNGKQGLAAHTARNIPPILEVLRSEFSAVTSVLEIGSGSGQHATAIASELDHLIWQTSDRVCNHASIREWLDAAAQHNVREPLALDVLSDTLPEATFDAVFSANTAHIMGPAAVTRLFAVAAALLASGGVFCLYGPFRQDGAFNADSNARFHASLQSRDPDMGIRDLEDVMALGTENGMQFEGVYGMPSNNLLIIWKRTKASG